MIRDLRLDEHWAIAVSRHLPVCRNYLCIFDKKNVFLYSHYQMSAIKASHIVRCHHVDLFCLSFPVWTPGWVAVGGPGCGLVTGGGDISPSTAAAQPGTTTLSQPAGISSPMVQWHSHPTVQCSPEVSVTFEIQICISRKPL